MEDLTPIKVRDSIIKCFYEAHKALLEENLQISDEEKAKFTQASITQIIKAQFEKNEYDFENPTKESLFYVLVGLAEIAKTFRNPDLIVNHFYEMLGYVKNLK